MIKIVQKLLFIIFGVLVGLSIVELFLRVIGVDVDTDTPLKPQYYYQSDALAGYDISENFPVSEIKFFEGNFKIWSNNIGCFDDFYNNEENFILLLGDSYAWGVVPFESNLGKRMEDYLGTRVLKCGVIGYGLRGELLKAEKIIDKVQKIPKVIVVGYYMNDPQDDYLFPEITVVNGRLIRKRILDDIETGLIKEGPEEKLKAKIEYWEKYCIEYKPLNPLTSLIKCTLERHSVLYRLSKDKISAGLKELMGEEFMRKSILEPFSPILYALLSFDKYQWVSSAWQDHFNNILEFKKIADNYGTKLLFVIIPTKGQVYPSLEDPLSEVINTYQPDRVLKGFLDENSFSYLDLLPYFQEYAKDENLLKPGGDLYWRYDSHWNIRGYNLASLLTSKYILENNLLELNEVEKNNKLKEVNNIIDSF